jgi:hypothetical protein
MEVKPSAVRGLKNACKLFMTDLQALPEESFTKSFGPATRTVADIVYEVNLVNDDVARVMRGQEALDWPEGWVKAPEGFNSKEVVVEAFRLSSERTMETAGSFSDEELESTIETAEGDTTRAERCRFMTLHIWYHSGQINYIQTLMGDDGWHWG